MLHSTTGHTIAANKTGWFSGKRCAIRHPFEHLEQRSVAIATVVAAVVFTMFTGVLLAAVSIEELARIRELAVAPPDTARQMLESWPSSTFHAFSFMLGFDLLYDLIHNNGVAFFAIWGAKRVASERAAFVASLTGWVMWLDSALNVVENLAFFHVIQTLEPHPLLPVAAAIFSFRSLTLVAGFLIGSALHAYGFWCSRQTAA